MLGTRYGRLGTRIRSLKHLKKTLVVLKLFVMADPIIPQGIQKYDLLLV